jgi:chromosome segregation ATPase
MVEPIMYLAIGFLISTLFGLMIMPLVHSRAVRLTTKRLEAATPLSMAEIQADKDQLRAEFAMSARRLEMSVDQLKNKTTSQLAELGKKSDAINRLKIELGEKNAAVFALEAREKAMKDQLRATEEEFAAKTQTLRTAEQALADKQHELEKLTHALSDRTSLAETRQVELAAMHAQVEVLKLRVTDAEREFGTTQEKLTEQRGSADAALRDLTEARKHGEAISKRAAELETQLLVHAKEAEMLGSRIGDLETRLATQGKLLAEREYENQQLRQQVEAARKTETALRAEVAAAVNGSTAPVVERLRGEKAAIEEQLRIARDDRAKLQRELNAMQQQAESSWQTERMENALLRERINDIAAEVAKLAATIEGPNSPIEAILAAEPARDTTTNGTATNGVVVTPGGTLADRIRALQSHASRARQTG